MLRNYHSYILIFLLGLYPYTNYAQEQLKLGSTKLEPQTILSENKIKCIVTPEISYDTNNSNRLKIVFYSEWRDKDNTEIKSNDHYLYVIENYDKLKEWESLEVPSGLINEVRNMKDPIVIFENKERIAWIPFTNGFLKFKNSSPPIFPTIKGDVGNIIDMRIYFTYSRKKSIKEINLEANWSFSIPSRIRERDLCTEKETQYNSEILAVNPSRQISYFTIRLEQVNVDISELENEFDQYLNSVNSLKEIKNKIKNDEDLNDCLEIKLRLTNAIRIFIPSDSKIEEIKQKIDEIKGKEKPQKEVVKVETKPKEKINKREAKKDFT